MSLYDLKNRGYNIVTKWQECNAKSILILITYDIKKFLNYKRLALKKNKTKLTFFFMKNKMICLK